MGKSCRKFASEWEKKTNEGRKEWKNNMKMTIRLTNNLFASSGIFSLLFAHVVTPTTRRFYCIKQCSRRWAEARGRPDRGRDFTAAVVAAARWWKISWKVFQLSSLFWGDRAVARAVTKSYLIKCDKRCAGGVRHRRGEEDGCVTDTDVLSAAARVRGRVVLKTRCIMICLSATFQRSTQVRRFCSLVRVNVGNLCRWSKNIAERVRRGRKWVTGCTTYQRSNSNRLSEVFLFCGWCTCSFYLRIER